MIEDNDFENLLEKYNNGLCNPEEKAVVENWFLSWKELNGAPTEQQIERASKKVWNFMPVTKDGRNDNKHWQRIGIAASIVLAIGIGFFYIKTETSQEKRWAHDITPGGNHATLTLASGKTINLSTTKTGIVIDTKRLSYSDGSSITGVTGEHAGMQMIATPKGGQYQVVLSDGTKVWLNAASTLKFPQSFARSVNRKIEIYGEAYLEVAKDKAHPFIVKSAGQTIEVLGTHFNINSYADEPMTKTTLLEGSVKVSSLLGPKGSEAIIKPGDQSQLNKDGQILVAKVNTKEVIAWKNGKFVFKDESLGSIMRKLSRWYNVDVIYQGIDPNETFWGSVSRFENVSNVLEKLELTGGVHFKIEGRKIYVSR